MRVERAAPILLAFAVLGPSQKAPGVSDLVKAATTYVAAYQQQLTAIVADEDYTQDVAAQMPFDPRLPHTRLMKSEVFFIFTSEERHWMAIRDVRTVDGREAPDRQDVRKLLGVLPAAAVARSMKESNSRWNIGRTIRNFNEPTLGLLVLDEAHYRRFKFERKGLEVKDGTTLATLAYVEKERPTLISGIINRHAFSRGQFVIEADTGRIRKAVLTTEADGVRVELTTEFTPHAKLGMLVPSVFRERYERGRPATQTWNEGGGATEYELISCEARYANYRRFETFGRLK